MRSRRRKRRLQMPEKLHRELKKQARKKGLKGERAKRYVYGTLAKVKKASRKKKA